MKLSDVFTSASVAFDYNKFQETNNTPPYLGTGLFPAKKKLGLDLKWLKGYAGLPVALMPSSFDAQVTVRDRIGITEIQTEMPFFRDSFVIGEADRQELLKIQEANSPYVKPVLDNIYADARNLLNGASVVPERMIWQLLAPTNGTPTISISANGVNKSYNYDPNGEWKKNNYKELATAWTDYTNADPIADIEAGMDAVEIKSGVRPTIAVMSKKTLNDIVKNAKIKTYIVSSANGGAARIGKREVVDYIAGELGLTVVVYEKKFKNENGVATSFVPDDIVTLLPGTAVGNTYYGTTPEEADLMATNANVSIVNTGVAVTVIHKNEIPVSTQTFASEIVLPSYEGMDTVYVINTNPAIGSLTVTSVAGSTTGKTKITVAETLTSGNSYKYKTSATVTAPEYGDDCSTGYTAWNGTSDITATTDNKILVVEVDSDNKAVKAGVATVTSKA